MALHTIIVLLEKENIEFPPQRCPRHNLTLLKDTTTAVGDIMVELQQLDVRIEQMIEADFIAPLRQVRIKGLHAPCCCCCWSIVSVFFIG